MILSLYSQRDPSAFTWRAHISAAWLLLKATLSLSLSLIDNRRLQLWRILDTLVCAYTLLVLEQDRRVIVPKDVVL